MSDSSSASLSVGLWGRVRTDDLWLLFIRRLGLVCSLVRCLRCVTYTFPSSCTGQRVFGLLTHSLGAILLSRF